LIFKPDFDLRIPQAVKWRPDFLLDGNFKKAKEYSLFENKFWRSQQL